MDDTSKMNSHEAQLLELGLKHIAQSLTRMGGALDTVNTRLEVLPLIQQAQAAQALDLARGADRMSNHDNRLQVIEREMPGLKELRRWVIGGIVASVSMMGAAILKMVIIDPARQPAPASQTIVLPTAPAPAAPVAK